MRNEIFSENYLKREKQLLGKSKNVITNSDAQQLILVLAKRLDALYCERHILKNHERDCYSHADPSEKRGVYWFRWLNRTRNELRANLKEINSLVALQRKLKGFIS